MLVESARTSPYAPVLDEQEYGAATKFLPKAVYDQINYMIKAEHLHYKDVRAPPPPHPALNAPPLCLWRPYPPPLHPLHIIRPSCIHGASRRLSRSKIKIEDLREHSRTFRETLVFAKRPS